jgi:hypothetical protein
MKRYKVKFYYYTDLKCDWEGDAYDDFRALGAALDHFNLGTWAIGEGFRIEISRA